MSVAYEAARSDPLAALKLAVELPADRARDELVTHVVSQWTAADPAGAAQWAEQIGEPLLRERVVAVVATAWAETDPAAAAQLALRSLSPGKPQDDAIVGIVQRWVQTEPEAAAAWVAQFPPGPVREAAFANLTALWPAELAAPKDLDQLAPEPAQAPAAPDH